MRCKDVETGLLAMVDKYGLQKVLDTAARVAKKGESVESKK